MHGRAHASTLPTLKRRTSPTSTASLRQDTETARSTGERAAVGEAAASSAAYGQSWTTPATLNTLSASLTRQQRQQQRHSSDAERGRATAATTTTSPSPSSSPQRFGQRVATSGLPGARHGATSPNPGQVTSSSFEGSDDAHNPAGGRLSQTMATASSALRAERLKELEDYMLQRAGRHATMADRQKAVVKSLNLLTSLHPPLSNVLDSVQRYMDDMAVQVRRAEEDKAAALHQQKQQLYVEFESFFEGKIRELVLARQKAEARAEAEHAAAFAVRQERDDELVEAKEELLQRLNECEHTEEQFRDFRHLIASVFQTNQQLMLRIDQLESVLARHRIDIPPASAELSAYTTSSEAKTGGGGNGDGAGGGGGGGGRGGSGSPGEGGRSRSISSQVPVAFMAAANKELVKSRLTLQQELLHSAFDDHSAYRLRIEGLTRKNQDLTFHIAELEEKMKELYTYIHQKRFITRIDEYGDETTPLTPRPREVPLALQTELGIELRHSTADILTELSTVAINMKHQLNSALLRARQLHTLSTWMNEADGAADSSSGAGALGAVLQEVAEASVIPVFAVSSWASIPHFLRTNVSPEVRNCFWTEAQAGCLFYNFFASYKAVRARARFVRDSKMLAPRVYQLFEHRRVLLTRLDANKEDAAHSVELIPFGYVVSQFARVVLAQLSSQNVQEALPLVLPGTITTRYPLNPPARVGLASARAGVASAGSTAAAGGAAAAASTALPSAGSAKYAGDATDSRAVDECEWAEAAPVVELEWTRFTYNMWYAAMRYQRTQPLCQLFVDLVDGRLPPETFDVMEAVLARVQRLVDQLDSERSHRFTYPRLSNGVVRWVNDTGVQSVLRGVQAVVRAFEDHLTPIHGGALTPLSLFADETYCDREEAASSLLADTAARRQQRSSVVVAAAAAANAKGGAAGREKPKTPLPGSLVIRQLPLPVVGATAASSLAVAPLGASTFVRFWRRFVRDMIEDVYSRIEAALTPLVEESEVVMGLYLISVQRAETVLAELDNAERQAALRSAVFGSDGGTGFAFGAGAQNPHDTFTGAKLVAEAADLLGVHGVARSFLTLLESRKGAVKEKKTTEQQVASETVKKALRQLPRFKIATHFPFRQQAMAAATAQQQQQGNDEGDAESVSKSVSAAASPRILTELPAPLVKKGGKKGGRVPRDASKRSPQARVASPTDAKGDPLPTLADSTDGRLASQRAKRSDGRKSNGRSSNSVTASSVTAPEPGLLSLADKTKAESVTVLGDLMLASKEGELVEWYTLRHTLRQTMPDFPFLLFRPDAFEQAQEAEKVVKAPTVKIQADALATVIVEEDE